MVTPDDAHASLIASHHRRELAERRAARRRRMRLILLMPALIGTTTIVYEITRPGLLTTAQMTSLWIGVALVIPLLATFDWLGERR